MSLLKKIGPQAVVVFLMAACVGVVLYVKPSFTVRDTEPQDPQVPRLQEDVFMRGTVTAILSEKEERDEAALSTVRVQNLTIRIDGGIDKGKEITAEHTIPDRPGSLDQKLEIGSHLVVGKNVSPHDTLYYISDVYRLRALGVIVGVFFLLILLFSGLRGVMAFLGLAFSLFMVMMFVIPQIIAGHNPFLISIVGTAVIACVSLYLAHGVNQRTSVALLATLISIGIALLVSVLAVRFAHIFGMGTEEAFFLQYAPIPPIDLRGLLLGGIIIGVLGILDDVTTAQSAAVEEIYRANPKLSFRELYRRGASVGREHITSLVNTLVLAYAGASFPLLLLFMIYERPAWVTLNSELVMEEIIRTLVGSITLIFAVPITTLLAVLVFRRSFGGRS